MQGQGSWVKGQEKKIHPTAIIHPNAEIGDGTEIGAYSVIGENAKIGSQVKIYPHVVVDGWTAIGNGCRIFQFASIGAPPQDLKFKGEPSEVIIGENNTIREFVTINRATLQGGGKTVVGSNNLFMAYVHVAHDCRIGDNNILANAATLAGHIEIFDNTIIGGLVAIHQFVRIGSYSIIGGASAVTKDIPPYVMAVGNRAKLYGLNKIGLRRHGFTSEEILVLKNVYGIIFRKGLLLKDALASVEEEIKGSGHVRAMVEFIKGSRRGMTRAKTYREEGEDE